MIQRDSSDRGADGGGGAHLDKRRLELREEGAEASAPHVDERDEGIEDGDLHPAREAIVHDPNQRAGELDDERLERVGGGEANELPDARGGVLSHDGGSLQQRVLEHRQERLETVLLAQAGKEERSRCAVRFVLHIGAQAGDDAADCRNVLRELLVVARRGERAERAERSLLNRRVRRRVPEGEDERENETRRRGGGNAGESTHGTARADDLRTRAAAEGGRNEIFLFLFVLFA